jgi:hypothetical protein
MFSTSGIPWLSALAFSVLARSREILVLVKPESQRNPQERSEVHRGLARGVVFEFLIFVPLSTALTVLILPPLILEQQAVKTFVFASRENSICFEALLGVLSYNFPFAAVRRFVTRVAFRTLQDFAAVCRTEPEREETRGELGRASFGE